ncbi:hypothetical protein ACQW02_21325 [Humitalea sp. 24SJ18S-53]|uniref:hypothetical protein n=1 Tax=Humitalea sp. 24SJ18S-53 TaxID=3422307 RepID=UPI003D66A04B
MAGSRAGRRLLVLGAGGLAGCVSIQTGGSGINDNDPSDRPGQGRGSRGAVAPRGYTGISDSDPADAPGQGRGIGYRAGGAASDADPFDAPGRGRGNVRRTSDSDPDDPAGQGRR